MSNSSSAPVDPQPRLVCRIGEAAWLAAGAGSECLEEAFGGRIVRQLDLLVDEHAFTALLLKSPLDTKALQPLGLLEFAAQLNLSASERSKLIATIFRLVSQVFGLARDSFLCSELVQLMATDGIAAGKMIAYRVDGIDTVICEASPRLKLDPGSLIVSFAEHLVVGETRAVEATIGRGREAMFAVVDFAHSPRNERVLLITPGHIAVVEMNIRLSQSVGAFSEAHARCLPELLNLLAIWNIGARTALAVVGRSEAAVAAVAVSCFGFRFEVTHVFSMDHGLFVSGWFVDPDRLLTEMWVVDYGLVRQAMCDKWVVTPARVSVDNELIAVRQFHAFVERRAGYAAPANLTIVVELRNGERHALYCPGCRNDARAMRDGILNSINHAGFGPNALVQAFLPAVNPLQTALNNVQGISEILDLGTRSTRGISIVIPLCRECEFIRPQLIAFHADPVLRSNGQIIYVVDDPLIAQEVRQILTGAAHIFALDVRLVVLERDGGDALASNLGAREADGQTIVLMKSNVVPETPGWLAPMMERLTLLPPSSVIGPKLIHADESLRHAGLYFHRLPDGQWQNRHLFTGYGRDFPPANVECEVPAVTGALMVLRRDDYLAVGGFSTDFIVGEYGASDLCFKLRSHGGQCLYMPSATFFHFEPQSMPDRDRRAGSTIYDHALHSLRWSETIAGSMAGMPEARHAG